MENNNTFLKEVGIKIRIARVVNDVSLEELSRLTGYSREAIGKIENGKKDFHILFVKAIADAMNTDVKDFL
jgi:transcriptional regulator with XRE-family HTH domain